MRRIILYALATAVLVGMGAAAAWADPGRNLEAILRPAAGGSTGFGLVEFRERRDADKVVHLDVWVRDLASSSSYSLQRATDTNVDDVCTGTNWLTLGEGSNPRAIHTDERGTGRAQLWRDLAAIPLGTQFDIHFRVIEAGTPHVVLESGCYQFTVRQ